MQRREKMKRVVSLITGIMIVSSLVVAQDVGTMAGTPAEGHVTLQFSCENASRMYDFDLFREKVYQRMYQGTLSYSFSPWVNVYGFVGSSDFPNSFADTKKQIYYGGGVKLMLIGGEIYIEENTRSRIHLKGGIGLDFKVGRLQSRDGELYSTFDLTEYQAAIDFGLRVLMVTTYCGFKLSWVNGDMTLVDETDMHLKGRGLFSMFIGGNVDLTKYVALTSEFSFFTEKSWSLGLRITV